tara:strand:+ start:45 stop:326 length:282 start_codon:yes stop_codon:yes gene_type:complete
MQLCTVYKSSKKADTYLYVEKKGEFDKVPEQLKTLLGKLTLVMTLDLDKRTNLGTAELAKVKQELTDNGFYLQLPPPTENMLDEFKKQQGHSE